MRSIAGYVTNKKRKTDQKETQKKLNKNFNAKFKQALIFRYKNEGVSK